MCWKVFAVVSILSIYSATNIQDKKDDRQGGGDDSGRDGRGGAGGVRRPSRGGSSSGSSSNTRTRGGGRRSGANRRRGIRRKQLPKLIEVSVLLFTAYACVEFPHSCHQTFLCLLAFTNGGTCLPHLSQDTTYWIKTSNFTIALCLVFFWWNFGTRRLLMFAFLEWIIIYCFSVLTMHEISHTNTGVKPRNYGYN